jgi:protein ImuA
MINAGRQLAIADLRRQLERLSGAHRHLEALPFGVPSIDFSLPAGGLARGALHEVMETGRAGEHIACATLFAAAIAARLRGAVLWCLKRRDLFAPGLAAVGLHPDRLIFAETYREDDLLPCMEEGLREAGLAAVVGEVTRLGLTASRRLQLAAEKSGPMALVIRRWRSERESRLPGEPTAALTRWRVSAAPSAVLPVPGVGRPRWRLDLIRCKGGEPHSWLVEAPDETGHLALPADLADGPPAAASARRAAA